MNQKERFEAAFKAKWPYRHPNDATWAEYENFKLGEASDMERAAAECERMELYAGGKQESPAHNDVWSAAKAIKALMAQGDKGNG